MLSLQQEAVVFAFRRNTLLPLDDCLYALQAMIPQLTRSSLHRCLQRRDLSRLPDVDGDSAQRTKFKSYPIGYFHIAIADNEPHERASTRVSADFLKALSEIVPYTIPTVFTDNGLHFTPPRRPVRRGRRNSARPGTGSVASRPRLRVRLRQSRHRPPTDQSKTFLDQRPDGG